MKTIEEENRDAAAQVVTCGLVLKGCESDLDALEVRLKQEFGLDLIYARRSAGKLFIISSKVMPEAQE